MNDHEIGEEELLYLVGSTDTEFFHAGFDIEKRYWEVPRSVMKKLGFVSYIEGGNGKPFILDRIEKIYGLIYRKQDIAMGGHIGVFMYRDIFARIGVLHVFGTVQLNPFDHVKLTPFQLRIIQTEPNEMAIFVDQFCDLADVQFGISALKVPFSGMELVKRFIDLSQLHMHGAAAILTGGYDFRGAVQNALLGTELALKAAVVAQGLNEDEIKKKFGHDLAKLISAVETAWPKFDAVRVRRVVGSQPDYVPNRYASTQPGRREVGHIVMGAQYILSEVVRQFSDTNFRSGLLPPSERQYPA